jgi:type 1 glutamine amidotransferase
MKPSLHCLFAATLLFLLDSVAAEKKIVLIAGRPSHGSGEHEFKAGSLLLAKCLENVPGVQAIVVTNGWPKDEGILEGAAAIMFFADGGDGHPAIQGDHLRKIDALVKKGAGIACVHYGVEVPKEKGGKEFIEWIGGYFEMNWSVNPHWDAEFKQLPEHPITRGVKPFKIRDEWYYHMRFHEGMKGVTPILSAQPTDSTLDRPDGTHSGNPAVREAVKKGEPQHLAWAYERPDGGRGFGFTGGHFHRNWGNENFRKIVLNALLWVARVDVPKNGVGCEVTQDDLKPNLDPKGK